MRLPLDPNLHADAYMQWASRTGFRYFNIGSSRSVVLLARFGRPLASESRARLWSARQVWISDRYDGYRCATVTCSPAALAQQLAILRNEGAECFELAAPVGIGVQPDQRVDVLRLPSGPDTVVGVIDDGCPFAHMHYRNIADPHSLALRYIWDQGGTVRPGAFGPVATPFAYGAAFLADNLQAILDAATTPATGLDEDTAYRISGLPGLNNATSHGAQVLSLATGHGHARPQPLSMLGRSDIAFVQLPPQALDDPSGGWLDHYALDGIHAIQSYARRMHANAAQRVIVNLSYGPQTGPHDGSSILETAIDELTEQARADGYCLKVVLPSGNSHRLRAHAEFNLSMGGGTVDWCVSPDSQLPSFLEIWLPEHASMDDLDISLISPAGERIPAVFCEIVFSADETAATVAIPVCGCPDKTMVLMAISPTARALEPGFAGFPLATPGRWKVGVQVRACHAASGVAHAYLARSDPNLGRMRRGRSGYLDSPGYDPDRYLRESEQLDSNQPVGRAEVAARGSINGLATGSKSGVAAGYRLSAGLPSPYSSGGPSRGLRAGPDWAYPTDDSVALSGVLAGGNRSGTVMRLIGTSFAAPQYARELSVTPCPPTPPDPPVLTPPWPPPGPPAWFTFRVGAGMR